MTLFKDGSSAIPQFHLTLIQAVTRFPAPDLMLSLQVPQHRSQYRQERYGRV
jgi:hypothetical protein